MNATAAEMEQPFGRPKRSHNRYSLQGRLPLQQLEKELQLKILAVSRAIDLKDGGASCELLVPNTSKTGVIPTAAAIGSQIVKLTAGAEAAAGTESAAEGGGGGGIGVMDMDLEIGGDGAGGSPPSGNPSPPPAGGASRRSSAMSGHGRLRTISVEYGSGLDEKRVNLLNEWAQQYDKEEKGKGALVDLS